MDIRQTSKIPINILYLVSIFIFHISCSSQQFYVPKQNDQIFVNGENNEISLITYNIQTVLGKGDDQLKGLVDYINNEQFDVITFQEVFSENVRTELIDNLNPNVYNGIVPRVDYESFPSNLNQDAGLFIASKFPQINLSNIDFGEDVEFSSGAAHKMLQKVFSLSMDFLANKSVVGALYQVNKTTKLFIFTTHLQAISSKFHKTYQLEQIYSFISNSVVTVLKNNIVNKSENLVVLLTGDFNYNAYHEGDTELLKQYLGNPRDLHKEFNDENEEYTMMSKLFGFYVRFDYIFAYDNIGLIPLRKVKATSINVTDVVDSSKQSISDHHAVISTISLKY